MPTNETFRFVAIRPPGGLASETPLDPPLIVAADRTSIHNAVADLTGDPHARAKVKRIANEYLASEKYVPKAAAYREAFAVAMAVASAAKQVGDVASAETVRVRIERAIGYPLADIRDSLNPPGFRQDLWNSIYAISAVPEVESDHRDALFAAIRAVFLIDRLAAARDDDSVRVRDSLSAPVIVPAELFPRPPSERERERSEQLVQAGEGEPQDRTTGERDALARARAEIHDLYWQNRRTALAEVRRQDLTAVLPARTAERASKSKSPWKKAQFAGVARPFWRADPNAVSNTTREVLEAHGLSIELFDLPQIVDRLDRQVALTAPQGSAGRRRYRILGPSATGAGAASWVAVGRPAPAIPVGPARRLALPAPHPYHVLGIGDLVLVRDTLLRYQLGEVAHIENVMASEQRKRQHRRVHEVEETEILETERIEEEQRDLETSDRFELQRESERTIQTDTNVQAGVTVSGSYGFVDVTATTNVGYSQSSSESERTALNYARSVTDRSVSRIQSRVREERIRRTRDTIDERNLHAFDNAGGAHVRGIYHWVDKLYSAQLVNYGRRLMLEFIVPEPAALYLHMMTHTVAPGVVLEAPETPEELNLTSPDDLTRQNYGTFIAAYHVDNVVPPPPERTVVGKAIEQADGSVRAKAVDLTIPEGFRAATGFVLVSGFGSGGPDTGGYVQIGGNYVDIWGAAAGGAVHFGLNYEDATLPVSVATDMSAYAMNVEVECELEASAFRKWQLDTYAKVVSAYQARKAEYDDALASIGARRGTQIPGRPPQRNRQIEREELKRGCITLLAATHYDEFNDVTIGPAGYPEVDEAAVLQHSPFIQFFEQALEWENLTYLLYPYFWGRKPNWMSVFALDDADSKFGEFLRAGSARVVVPVRPPYNDLVVCFIAGGGLPTDGPAPTINSPLYRSIAQELRSQQGADFQSRAGALRVRRDSADVQGDGTSFTADDIDREIQIEDEVYRIAAVTSATAIELGAPYRGADADRARYLVGPRLMGPPWRVVVPTALVYLSESKDLPEYPVVPV